MIISNEPFIKPSPKWFKLYIFFIYLNVYFFSGATDYQLSICLMSSHAFRLKLKPHSLFNWLMSEGSNVVARLVAVAGKMAAITPGAIAADFPHWLREINNLLVSLMRL